MDQAQVSTTLDGLEAAATPTPAPRTISVVSVPAGHPYVRHTQPLEPGSTGLVVRPDPDPDDPSQEAGERWWPPVALDPDWVRGEVARDALDLLHLHFGYDDRTPAQLAALVDALDEAGRPLVLTVHDLRNPHHEDASALEAQLDVLVPRAAAVVTLTSAAAEVVQQRWGVSATVLAHPHVVDLGAMARLRELRRSDPLGTRVVGVAVKDLRSNTDPLGVLPALARVVRRHEGARLRVTAHRTLHDRWDERASDLVTWLDAECGDDVEVVWHDRWSDAELWAELAGLHVAVLPYRFGTHSGWLEACHDVGTRVLAPSHGCYADQGADATFDWDDEASLEAALERLLAEPGDDLVGLEADERAAQRTHVADVLHATYLAVLSEGSSGEQS